MLIRPAPRKFWNLEKMANLQWQLTAKCEGNCRFCYMLDSPSYKRELENELALEQCLKVVEDFAEYLRERGFQGWVSLSGGDPLLKEGFWDILSALKNIGVRVGVLGNHHLINSRTADKLKRYGVEFYQLSVDGTRETHDYFRGAGSFEKTWQAAGVLREYGIPVTISLTLSQKNVDELPQMVELCYRNRISSFRPSRLVPEGKGKDFSRDLLYPARYKEVLFNTIKEIISKSFQEGYFLNYPICDPLAVALSAGVEGNYVPLHLKAKLIAKQGCHQRFLALLPDGTVYPCRRLPIEIGNITKMSFPEAYDSELAAKLRDPHSYKKCSGCDLVALCGGGCPAVTYAVTGDPFGKDPQCWVNTENRPQIGSSQRLEPTLRESNNFRRLPEIEKGARLFQPLKIGSLISQNRIFRSATLERMALPDGSPTEGHGRIYRELARGECGLIITGVAYVAEEGKINGGQNGMHEDRLIGEWKKITDDIHLYGGKIAMQLTHQSINSIPYAGELMGPSPHNYLTRSGKFAFSREMKEEEILAVIQEFKLAILRAEAAGFDAVQLQLAHGYLLGLFLSPRINLRKDQWGGSLENRLRISTEIVKGAKKEFKNKHFPIMVKINSADDWLSRPMGGLTVEEASEAISILAGHGVEAFELSGGGSIRSGTVSGSKECYFQKEGEFIRKNNSDVVLGICGGIRSGSKMNELLNQGFDFVSLSRPFIREPDLAKKIRQNPVYRAECVSCSFCHLKIMHYPLQCYLKHT